MASALLYSDSCDWRYPCENERISLTSRPTSTARSLLLYLLLLLLNNHAIIQSIDFIFFVPYSLRCANSDALFKSIFNEIGNQIYLHQTQTTINISVLFLMSQRTRSCRTCEAQSTNWTWAIMTSALLYYDSCDWRHPCENERISLTSRPTSTARSLLLYPCLYYCCYREIMLSSRASTSSSLCPILCSAQTQMLYSNLYSTKLAIKSIFIEHKLL